MPMDVSWFDDSKTIVLWDVHGSWTIEEFYNAVNETKKLVAEYPQARYGIIDSLRVTGRPTGNLFQLFRSAASGVELDRVVYVSERRRSKLIEMLVGIVFRTSKTLKVKEFKLAESIDDALAILTVKEQG